MNLATDEHRLKKQIMGHRLTQMDTDKSNIKKIIQAYKKYDNENTPMLHQSLTLAERAVNGR